MLSAPILHPVQHIRLRFRIHRINLHQMLFVPVIRGVVVHGDFFPDPVGHEADCVFMPRYNSGQNHIPRFAVIIPLFSRNFFPGRPVDNLPVFERFFGIIDSELFREEILHQIDG
ncbi:hypothetical protein D3C75_588720 [compost metagenome]